VRGGIEADARLQAVDDGGGFGRGALHRPKPYRGLHPPAKPAIAPSPSARP
jgi:hypothetical protein